MRASLTRIAGATTTSSASRRWPAAAGSRASASASPSSPSTTPRASLAGGSLSVRRSSRTAVPGAPSASAARAASRSSTTTAGSPAGSPRSRWAPTRVLRAPSIGQHQAGAPVAVGERGGGDPLVHRALHQRVDEAQRRRRRQDLRGDQAIGGMTRAAAGNPGQRGRLSQRGALEHRDRAGKVPRVGAEPVQPRHHRPRHRLRAHALDARGARRHRLDLFRFELGDQLPDEERVPGAGSRACRAEIGVGVRPERGADERRDRARRSATPARSGSRGGRRAARRAVPGPSTAPRRGRSRSPTRPARRSARSRRRGTGATVDRPSGSRRRRAPTGPVVEMFEVSR